jgi:hypothetical protein
MSKKVTRDEKELSKLLIALSGIKKSGVNWPACANSDSVENNFVDDRLSESLRLQKSTLEKEIEFVKSGIERSTVELVNAKKTVTDESGKITHIIQWMLMLQKIVWPVNEETLSFGIPLGSRLGFTDPIRPNVCPDDCERTLLTSLLTKNLLPDGLMTMAHTAIAMNIQDVEDVLLCVDAFRWMSWCNICLHLLRF